jgi:hypothetical protein
MNSAAIANIGIGFDSLKSLTSGTLNTTLGYNTGTALTTGSSNVFLGTSAGRYTTTGSNIIGIGFGAGQNNTTGTDNVFIGYLAGSSSTSSNNVLIGGTCGVSLTSGSSMTGTGSECLSSATTGHSSAAYGYKALQYLTVAIEASAFGYEAGRSNVVSSKGAYFGKHAGYDISGLTKSVSSVTDYSGTMAGTILINSTGHGFTTGNSVALSLSVAAYNGVYTVTVVDANSFYVTKTYSATATGYCGLNAAVDGLNTLFGYNTGRGIVYGTGNTILGANVTGLAADLSSNIILASNSTVQMQFNGTDWIVSSGLRNFADDAAAAAGSPAVPLKGLYRNGSVVMYRVS